MSGELLKGPDWSNDADWSSGAKAETNDDVIMSNVLTQNITTGIASANNLDFDLLSLPEGFTFALGSTSSPIRTAADFIQHLGMGWLYFECDNGAGSLLTDEILIACGQASAGAEIGSLAGNAGDITKIVINRGNVLLKANIMFTDDTGRVELRPIDGQDSNVTVTIAEGADTLPILEMDGGVLDSSGPITLATQRGGTLVQDKAAIATLDLKAGVCEYEWTAATTVTVHTGATLNLLTNAKKKTITNFTAYKDANVIFDSRIHTFTNETWIPTEG